MSRRREYVATPRCVHTEAIWREYEAAMVRATGENRSWPARPEAEGYCDPCWTALCHSRAPWPADVWAKLHAKAAYDYCPSKPLRPYKLPKYQEPRKENASKWLARAREAYQFSAELQADIGAGRIKSVTGSYVGKDRKGIPWKIDTTNGHCALLVPGGDTKLKPLSYISPETSDDYLDLPPAFQLALRRVRLLSNERSEAVKLTINPESSVTLSASSPEYGTAEETVDVVLGPGSPRALLDGPTIYQVCLSADYLDATCGSWPLRWYLRPPQKRERPGCYGGPVTTSLEEQPQLFAPAAIEARVLIMPMRI